MGSIGEIIAGLLLGIANARWWKDVFVPEQLIPYCGIFLEGQDPAEDPITIHRLRNFFHAEQDVHPSRNDLSFNHPFLLEYSDRHWFIFALNGGSFLGCNPPESPFFKETLPQHLSSQYFYLFLISLYQRFVLISLSERVAAHWVDEADEYERRVGFQRIRESFLTFTARGYFTQIMQQEHHHRNYRKWQEVFQINDLYAEVSGEIREMFEWLQLRLTERQAERMRAFERRATLFGIFFAVCVGLPSLVTSFLSMNIRDLPDTVDLNFRTAISIIGITVGFGLLIGAIVFLMMRDDLSPQASRQSPPNSGSSDTEARQKN